jgi:hypothetical protein
MLIPPIVPTKVCVLGRGNKDRFEKGLVNMLKNENYDVHISHDKILPGTQIIILNLIHGLFRVKQKINAILKSKINKLIILEDAKTLYLNSKTSSPFSVYKKLCPTNKKCKVFLELEESMCSQCFDTVVFRISELYGPNVDFGLIHELFHKDSVKLNRGKRDFIYEGDLIHAIEVALKANAIGLFDIAFGNSVDLKSELAPLIIKHRSTPIEINWRGRGESTFYNCENFKFYKWKPLVNLDTGFKAIAKLKNEN